MLLGAQAIKSGRCVQLRRIGLKHLQQPTFALSLANYHDKGKPEDQEHGPKHDAARVPKKDKPEESQDSTESTTSKSKTTAQSDEELRENMEKMMSGDGGLAGAELEGGQPVGLKRGVKNNMFRLI